MTGDDNGGAVVDSALGEAVACVRRAAWGFTNGTDIVTLPGGERVVLQRYRRSDDAVRRLRIKRALGCSSGSPARARAPSPPHRRREAPCDRGVGRSRTPARAGPATRAARPATPRRPTPRTRRSRRSPRGGRGGEPSPPPGSTGSPAGTGA